MNAENLQLISCRNCGNSLFTVGTSKASTTHDLFIQCTECRAIGTVTASKPKIEISWGTNGNASPIPPQSTTHQTI